MKILDITIGERSPNKNVARYNGVGDNCINELPFCIGFSVYVHENILTFLVINGVFITLLFEAAW